MLQAVTDTVNQVLLGAKKATKYLSPKEVVKATYRGKRDKRSRSHTILVTLGSPNYEEREFITKAKKAGEPFPIKKIQLKFPAKRR
jgi:hypothetical protein